MRLLVMASEPIDADALREAAGDVPADAEVLVVSPALHDSALRFVMSDADAAIGHAHEVQEETVDRLDEAGIDAAGRTGDSNPLQALADSLATYAADRVVVFTHQDGQLAFNEGDWLDEARERFDVPIEHRLVTR